MIYGFDMDAVLERIEPEDIKREGLLELINKAGLTKELILSVCEDNAKKEDEQIILSEMDTDSILEFMDSYEGLTDDTSGGVAGMLVDIINMEEGLDLIEENGVAGIVYDLPWCYTAKMQTMTKGKFMRILNKYLNKLFSTNIVESIEYGDYNP